MQPNSVPGLLLMRQLQSGGWSYFGSQQSSVEATLAVMALSTESPDAARSGLDQLVRMQRRDGAWPAFGGDSDASWTTALLLCALNLTGEFESAREKGLSVATLRARTRRSVVVAMEIQNGGSQRSI
jgi:hypothetical protein